MIDQNQIEEGELTEEQRIYKENILDHYKHPRNKHTLVHASVEHMEANPLCGDTVTISLIMKDDVVQDVAFQGKGCAISQASVSMLTDRIKGMSAEEIRRMNRDDILAMLGIPIGIVRMKCAMLGLRTAQAAIEKVHA